VKFRRNTAAKCLQDRLQNLQERAGRLVKLITGSAAEARLVLRGVFTDAEVASIAQLVAADPLVSDKTLMCLHRLPDGSVSVTTGVLVAPLDGRGDLLLLRHDDDRWVVADRARWGS
jgi:hypothetical protein